MSTREKIASALSTMARLHPTPTMPDVPSLGSAWPVWVSAQPGPYGGLVNMWWVLIVLPNATMQQTVEAADPLVDGAWARLLDVGEVTVCEPVQVTINDPAGSGQQLPAIRYTLTTVGER
jgi:hypothetical protein